LVCLNLQIDRFAVAKATEKDLQDLGLSKKGVVLCGVGSQEIKENKRKLLSEFYQTRSKAKKTKFDESLFTEKPNQKKSIEAGLMQQKYTTLRLNKGGGT